MKKIIKIYLLNKVCTSMSSNILLGCVFFSGALLFTDFSNLFYLGSHGIKDVNESSNNKKYSN